MNMNFLKKSVCFVFAIIICGFFVQSVNCLSSDVDKKSNSLSLENPDKNANENTIYAIASISKVYVTTAVMQLVDKGLVDLDKPVTTYIKDFKMADSRYKDITVRMLMNHTSGIMGTSYANAWIFDDNDTSYHDSELLSAVAGQRLKANPGEFSTYCNDGFDLLEILVERVSGMDFTDYLTENIAKPIGAFQTGSYKNLFRNPNLAKVYDDHKQPYTFSYHTGIGTGGVLSTAIEVCKFGSTFFTGDNTLLSEKTKSLMAEDQSKNKYEGHYALGWDDVDFYADTEIKVVMKGGDLGRQHGELVVAPEEKISVAVLSSGGSSVHDTLFAKSLLDIALFEMGKNPPEFNAVEYTLLEKVPSEYKEYEGLYSSGQEIYNVTFPEMKYLKMEICDKNRSVISYYKYSTEGKFVCMLGDVPSGKGVQNSDSESIGFEKRENGRSYIVEDIIVELDMLGKYAYPHYKAEKMEKGTATKDAVNTWKARNGKYYLTTSKYSNAYNDLFLCMNVKTSETLDGYLYAEKLEPRVLAIADKNHAVTFVNIPGQNGRDMMDITAFTEDGKECIKIVGSEAVFVSEKYFPDFTADTKKIDFEKREMKWFIIKNDMGGKQIGFEKTEQTSIYIYDKYDNCIYNSYMSGFGEKIQLPMEGKIMFAGEAGERVSIK